MQKLHCIAHFVTKSNGCLHILLFFVFQQIRSIKLHFVKYTEDAQLYPVFAWNSFLLLFLYCKKCAPRLYLLHFELALIRIWITSDRNEICAQDLYHFTALIKMDKKVGALERKGTWQSTILEPCLKSMPHGIYLHIAQFNVLVMHGANSMWMEYTDFHALQCYLFFSNVCYLKEFWFKNDIK